MSELESFNGYNTNQQNYNSGYNQNYNQGYQNQYSSDNNNGNTGYNQNVSNYANSGVGYQQSYGSSSSAGSVQSSGYGTGSVNGLGQNGSFGTGSVNGLGQNGSFGTGSVNGLGQNGSYGTGSVNGLGQNAGYQNSQLSYGQLMGMYPNQPNRLAPRNGKKIKVSFNSPAILSFAIVCLVVLIIQYISGDIATYYVFSVYRSSLVDPLTYVRFFGHALGHADLDHYMSNMMYLLIVGPLLEEKYGSKSIILVMVVTSFVTGVINFIFCPDVATLGASGIVFAFILLSSLTCMKQGEIPLTFIVVAILYLGEQVLEAAFVDSNISNVSHIVGGLCGCVLGYLLNKNKIATFNNGSSVSNSNSNNTYY